MLGRALCARGSPGRPSTLWNLAPALCLGTPARCTWALHMGPPHAHCMHSTLHLSMCCHVQPQSRGCPLMVDGVTALVVAPLPVHLPPAPTPTLPHPTPAPTPSCAPDPNLSTCTCPSTPHGGAPLSTLQHGCIYRSLDVASNTVGSMACESCSSTLSLWHLGSPACYQASH